MPRSETQKTSSSKRKAPAAKKTTRVGRGRSLLSRDARPAGRIRTSIQSLRRRRAALGVEVGAVCVMGFGLLLLLSVLSYHPADTRVGIWGLIESDPVVRNWVGPIGAATSEMFVALLGVTAFVLPVLLVLLGATILGRRSRRPRAGEFAGFVGVVASLALLVHLVFPDVPFRGEVIAGGGWMGDLLSALLVGQLSTPGTWVVGTTALLVSARIAFGVRIFGMGRLLGGRVGDWLTAASAAVANVTSAAFRNVARGLGSARASAREGLDDWKHEREMAREERHWEREERRAMREQERLDQEELADQDALLGPEDSIGLGSTLTPPEAHRKSRVRRPTLPDPASLPPLAEAPAPEEAPEAALDGLEVTQAAADVVAQAEFIEEPVSERIDSMRGATTRGVVHAVIEVGKGQRAQDGTVSKPRIHSAAPKDKAVARVDRVVSARRFLRQRDEPFELPQLSLLDLPPPGVTEVDEIELESQAARLEETLTHYGVRGRVTDILPGPVVTMFEFEPEPGIKVSKIAGLGDDLAMALRALKVRIVAPIPGKGAVGIEIPSPHREMVYFREILASNSFRKTKARLPLALGKGIDGSVVTSDMARMPHILVAGTTGSGKSVCVNTVLLSLLFGKTPEQVRLILVDPKMLEFSIYDGIPHLLVPVVTSPKRAAAALNWAVREMERRYKVLSAMGVRNISGYNERAEALQGEWAAYEKLLHAAKDPEKPDCGRAAGEDTVCYRSRGDDPVGAPDKMPNIVIIIDELADLMMVARKEVEESIVRLAQMARAAGIHMLLATQRPSVDVITGLIKANFPTRLSFRVSSKVDSRTVLDANGAENLLGLGDGLFLGPGTPDVVRVHGAFVSDEEVGRVVAHLKSQGEPIYVNAILEDAESGDDPAESDDDLDEMYDQCVAVVAEAGKASTSLLQRRLKLGYNRAARIMDAMERRGVIGPQDGARPREVFVKPYEF